MSYTGHEHQALIAAMDQDIVRRMRNWVAWRRGGSNASSCSFLIDYGTGISSGYRKASIPVFVAEAQLTDRAIRAAPDELGSAVALFWLGGEDLSFVAIGAHLGCTHVTVKARILRGHTWITAEIYRLGAPIDTSPRPGEPAGPRTRPQHGPVVVTRNEENH